ncbi:MAG TPA: choice-of-anchor D domain-containing protein [Polyangiaceae bacterium]
MRRALLGAIVILAPLLAAGACNEPDLEFSVLAPTPAYIEQSNSITVTVQNVGGVDATLGEVSSAALGLTPPFALDTTRGTCTTGTVLAKSYGGNCTLYVLLTPSRVDFYRQSLALAYGWGDGETRSESKELVVLAAPPLEGFRTGGDYGARPLHLSTRQTYSIQNRGTNELVLGDLSEAGLGLQLPFHRNGGTCESGQRLSPNASCSIWISFVPTALQAFTNTATLRYGLASRGTLEFSNQLTLQGTGTAPVRVSANAPLSQPAAPGTSRRDTVTFTNWGGATAVLGTVTDAVLGLAPPFSIAGGTCTTGATLAPQTGSCTLELQFSPTEIGTFQDELQLPYTYAHGAAFSISKRLSSRAEANPSARCFDTGCPDGQICSAAAPGAGTCVEVPPPPPNCMAPCLWEARRHCLPTFGECTEETTPISTLTCDADTGWAVQSTRFSVYQGGGWDTRSRRFGTECFAERRYDATGFLFTVTSSYTDGSQPIAYADDLFAQPGTRKVYCGPYTGTQAPPGVAPFVEQQTPECSAWIDQYLNPTGCQSSSPGTCSGL